MKVRNHIYTSAVLSGTIYALTQSVQIAISAFVSGVLIDVDHIFDFLVFSGERFSIKDFFSWCYDARWKKIILLFHSYEGYLVLGIIILFHPNNILIGVLLGGGLHLMIDQIGNRNYGLHLNLKLSPMFYFLTYRCFVGFHKDKLLVNQPHLKK